MPQHTGSLLYGMGGGFQRLAEDRQHSMETACSLFIRLHAAERS